MSYFFLLCFVFDRFKGCDGGSGSSCCDFDNDICVGSNYTACCGSNTVLYSLLFFSFIYFFFYAIMSFILTVYYYVEVLLRT